MRRFLLALAFVAASVVTASAQITIPNTLQPGAVIRAAELNTNFDTLGTKSLNRITGGNIEGNITLNADVTFDGVDISDFLLTTGQVRAQTAGTVGAPSFSRGGDTDSGLYFPAADEVGLVLGGTERLKLDANGLTVFGVNIINSSGKIPALSSTYLADLSGANLTGLNASNLASGTVPDARLSSNVPLKNAANTFTATQTGTNFTASGKVTTATFQVTGGTPEVGKVLTSDASGNATWQDAGIASGAVPSGMVAMFTDACPVSWTRLVAWDDKFVRGGETYDEIGGGQDTHTHSVDAPSTASTSAGSHTHSVNPASTATTSAGSHTHTVSGTTGSGGSHSHTGTTDSGGSHTHSTNGFAANGGSTTVVQSLNSGGAHTHSFTTGSASAHTHSFSDTTSSSGSHSHDVDIAATTSSSDGAHTHDVDIAAFDSASGSNVPAYVTVIFCQKD